MPTRCLRSPRCRAAPATAAQAAPPAAAGCPAGAVAHRPRLRAPAAAAPQPRRPAPASRPPAVAACRRRIAPPRPPRPQPARPHAAGRAAASAPRRGRPAAAAPSPRRQAPRSRRRRGDRASSTTCWRTPSFRRARVGILALLLGFGFYRAQQRKKSPQVDSSFLESRLQPDSFFGASGGQRIDTNEGGADRLVDGVFAQPARCRRRRRPGRRSRRLPGLRARPAGRGNPQGGDAHHARSASPSTASCWRSIPSGATPRRSKLVATEAYSLTRGDRPGVGAHLRPGPGTRPVQSAVPPRRPAGCEAAPRRRRCRACRPPHARRPRRPRRRCRRRRRPAISTSTSISRSATTSRRPRRAGPPSAACRASDGRLDVAAGSSQPTPSLDMRAAAYGTSRTPARLAAAELTPVRSSLTSILDNACDFAPAASAPQPAGAAAPAPLPTGRHDRIRPGRACRWTSTAGSQAAAPAAAAAAKPRRLPCASRTRRRQHRRLRGQQRAAAIRWPPSSRWPRNSTPSATPTARAAWREEVLAEASGDLKTAPSACSRKSADAVPLSISVLEGLPMRLALGISYNGQAYEGWQSQPSGRTVQDQLENALAPIRRPARFHRLRRPHRRRRARPDAGRPLRHRPASARSSPGSAAPTASCRRTSRCSGRRPVPDAFHSRASATGAPLCLCGAGIARCGPASMPAASAGCSARWTRDAMREAAALLVGEHDFSSFRAVGVPGAHAGQDAWRRSPSPAAAPIGASTSRPTPSCTT